MQVIYLMSGPAHVPYLLVSICTLRKHHPDIPVTVYAWQESIALVDRIAQDKRLNIESRIRHPAHRNKNAQFMDKILLAQGITGSSKTIYLDADTIVAGDLSALVDAVSDPVGFVATQFCTWTSKAGVIRRRLDRLKTIKEVDQRALQQVVDNDMPSLNGGVFAFNPLSPVLRLWYQWTVAARDLFIADECCLHVLQASSLANQMMYLPGIYNCSPKHRPRSIRPHAVRVWHGHGDSFVRPQKCPGGVEMWTTLFRECVEQNLGLVDMWPTLDCGNKYFRSLLANGYGSI